MKLFRPFFAGAALSLLVACGPPAPQTSGASFPPFGEEASKIWLEENRRRAPVAVAALTAEPIEEVLILDPDLPAPAPPPVAAVRVAPAPAPAPKPVVATPVAVAPVASLDAGGAAALFVQVCLKTANAPDAAYGILQSLGFRETAPKGNQINFVGPGANATLYRDGPRGGFGQCVIQPSGVSYDRALPAFQRAITRSGIPVEQSPKANAYLIRNTGALAVISRAGPAMTRTKPGVFRN